MRLLMKTLRLDKNNQLVAFHQPLICSWLRQSTFQTHAKISSGNAQR